jgi:DNA-binding NarL/FixJ family response regulator
MAASRFIVADDHPMVRDSLVKSLRDRYPSADFDECGTLADLLGLLQQNDDVDLIVLDLQMPGSEGHYGLVQIRKEFPTAPVAVVSGVEDTLTIQRALAYGAAAFIPKSLPAKEIFAAIETVLAGGVWTPPGYDPNTPADQDAQKLAARLSSLTPQQLRVLGMLGEGLLNKQIAYNLNVSEATIKAHVSAILQKLDVDSRTQAVIALNESGLFKTSRSLPPA